MCDLLSLANQRADLRLSHGSSGSYPPSNAQMIALERQNDLTPGYSKANVGAFGPPMLDNNHRPGHFVLVRTMFATLEVLLFPGVVVAYHVDLSDSQQDQSGIHPAHVAPSGRAAA